MTSTPATSTITFEQDANGRWRIYADGAPVHTVGRRVGQFRTREDAEVYAASRFLLKPAAMAALGDLLASVMPEPEEPELTDPPCLADDDSTPEPVTPRK